MTTATYTDRDITVDGLRIHYQEWGDPAAPTILMVHGFGVSGHMFDEFAERARDRFHLIAVDQRGHGDSDWAADGDYTRDSFVKDLEGIRSALGLEAFVLMGHSMGGLNAISYATRYPQYLKSLILVDVGPESAKEGVDNIVRFTRGPDELDFEEFVEMAHRFNPRRSLENIRERMRHRLKPTENGKWTWKFDRRFRSDRDSLRVGSDMSNDEMWALFRSVTVPTLIVRGAESDVLTQDVAERTASEMPQAKLVVVPGAGHSVPGDNPDDFSAVVAQFLGEVESGSFRPPAAQQAAAPIAELVRENEIVQRSRPGVGTLVALGVGAAVATIGIAYGISRVRRKRTEKARLKRLQQVRVRRNVDLDAAQHRMAALAAELATLGKHGAERARQLASEVDLEAALAQARAAATDAGHRSVEAVQHVDRKRLVGEGEEVARRSRNVVLRAARNIAGLLQAPRKARRRRSRRLLAWRS
jgi:esterase